MVKLACFRRSGGATVGAIREGGFRTHRACVGWPGRGSNGPEGVIYDGRRHEITAGPGTQQQPSWIRQRSAVISKAGPGSGRTRSVVIHTRPGEVNSRVVTRDDRGGTE